LLKGPKLRVKDLAGVSLGEMVKVLRRAGFVVLAAG